MYNIRDKYLGQILCMWFCLCVCMCIYINLFRLILCIEYKYCCACIKYWIFYSMHCIYYSLKILLAPLHRLLTFILVNRHTVWEARCCHPISFLGGFFAFVIPLHLYFKRFILGPIVISLINIMGITSGSETIWRLTFRAEILGSSFSGLYFYHCKKYGDGTISSLKDPGPAVIFLDIRGI